MERKPFSNKYCIIIFSLFIIIHLILICSLRIYPFIDLPNHLSEATILRYYSDLNNEFSKYYSIHLFPKPNIFHMVFCSLNIFPSPEIANKIFYALYVLLLPLSIFLVIKKMGGNLWFVILSFPFIYNYNVSCGLTGFTMAIPLVIILYCIFSREKHTLIEKISISILFLLLFTVHIMGAVFALLLFFLIKIFQNKGSVSNLFKEFFVTVPVIILTIVWWIKDSAGGENTLPFIITYYKNEYFQTILKRFGLFMYDNYFLFDGRTGPIVSLIFSGTVIIPFLYYLTKNRKELHEKLDKKTGPMYIFFLVSLGCFILLPDRIPENWCLYERFSVFVFISIIIILSNLCSKRISKIFIIIICLISLLHLLLWSGYFISFQKENSLFNKSLFPVKTKGKILVGLIEDNQYRGKPVYLHFPNYYIIWNKGIAATMIIDYRFGPVRKKSDIIPSYLNMVLQRNNPENLKNIDYYLVRSESKTFPLINHFKPVRSQGNWCLYENRFLITSFTCE